MDAGNLILNNNLALLRFSLTQDLIEATGQENITIEWCFVALICLMILGLICAVIYDEYKWNKEKGKSNGWWK